MDAVTYPEEAVVDFVMANTIPLRLRSDAQPYAADFNLIWTPTLISLDTDGREHHRTVGFLPPEDLIPSVLLGIAKTGLGTGRFAEALAHLESILNDYPESGDAPEAVYWRGVGRYKSTHNPKPLKEAYERLASQHSGSVWTRRAYPYRLL
jgi:hypothetical protein